MSTTPVMTASPLDSLLTADDLAEQLHTTTRNLREWRSTGRGPRFVRVGRLPLYRLEAVEEWLREQEYASTADELR